MILKRKKRERFNIREEAQWRSRSYQRHIRGFVCAVSTKGVSECQGPVVAHHVRRDTDGSTSQKPSDWWLVPLCHGHHMEGHTSGFDSFEKKYRIDLRVLAERLWKHSRHFIEYMGNGNDRPHRRTRHAGTAAEKGDAGAC